MNKTIRYNNFTLTLTGDSSYGQCYILKTDDNMINARVIADENNQVEGLFALELDKKDIVEAYERENYDTIQDAVYKWSILTTIMNMADRGTLEMKDDYYKKTVQELIKIAYKK